VRVVVLVVLLSISVFAQPLWYYYLPASKANTYIGFGSGVDESHAKQEAFNDISAQIAVSVDTSMTQKQRLQNGEFQSIEEFTGSQSSSAVLYDYVLVKSEYSDGKYYVAIEYENIPSLDKFVNKIKKNYELAKLKNELQNSYIKETQIAKKLFKKLGKNIDFSLLRKDKRWCIRYKNIVQVLDSKDFAKFFSSVASKNLEINTNKRDNILYNEDMFFFRVKSNKTGYVSIFTVYEDGTVAILMRNIPIKKNTLTSMPDEEFESIAQASLMKKGEETYDLYVLLYSKQKMMFDSFAYADEELIQEEKYKNFDELIEFINNQDYATLKVVTKPRM
jgi:hypothetical protein